MENEKKVRKIITPKIIVSIINFLISKMKFDEALRFLFSIDRGLYLLEGKIAIKYGNGVHTKHGHIRYHDFFIENINRGQSVIDIGSGNGELDIDIATRLEGVKIVGIEKNKNNYLQAQKKCAHKNITYINYDALSYDYKEKFDVVIMSNFLEHIEERIGFLKKLVNKCQPKYFLIRVPMHERDWRVPLQAELGMDYRLDATHCIEYKLKDLETELKSSGLIIEQIKVNWGEYWVKVLSSEI